MPVAAASQHARAWIIRATAFCFLGLFLHGSSAGDKNPDRIWSALILASNAEEPVKPPAVLAKYSDKVQRVFGYNQLKLIGSATKTVDEDCERWLVPSQNFWMSVKARKGDRGAYQLDLELYHDKRRIVQSGAKLSPDSTIMIRGPMHASGQLLIVLQLQD
jgi:hypothetical protein